MPLPLPQLDNRIFDELVAEGRMLLPQQASKWTDYNFHDPGITLLELFAWLTEIDIYRLDRTLEAGYRAFLRLVGVEVRPALVADTVLIFGLKPSGVPLLLPAGLQIGDDGGDLLFQTTSSLYLSAAQLVALYSGQNNSWVDNTTYNQSTGQLYQPFGPQPTAGVAFYLGFDLPLAAEAVAISLYAWTGTGAADRATRALLMAELEAIQAEMSALCPTWSAPDQPEWWQHYSVRTRWEYYSLAGEWVPLLDVMDATRALTLSGPISFTAPLDQAPGGPDDVHFFIRCQLLSGSYECPPTLEKVAINTIAASHAADVEAETLLGASNGWAGQRFAVNDAPIVPNSAHLRVMVNNVEDDPWHIVNFWDLVGPHERAFVLSPHRNAIVFGNGRQGRVVMAGAAIWLKHQVGGGPQGNISAGTLTSAMAGPHNAALVSNWESVRPTLHITQPFAAMGGAPAETLAEAQGRALATLAAQRGAITLADFEALALATPGVPVARTRALADFHPAVPCFPAPGCVTVVVVPHCPDPSPTPGPDLRQAVARYLDRRRMLATEVHVIAPCYTPVVVHARLHVEPNSGPHTGPHSEPKSLAALAQRRLDNFFHPLHGGPDGTGWPVGRDVYRAEVMALLNALPGVVYVDGLGLETEGDLEPRCGNLPICPDCLVASGQHQIGIEGGWSAASRSKVTVVCK